MCVVKVTIVLIKNYLVQQFSQVSSTLTSQT